MTIYGRRLVELEIPEEQQIQEYYNIRSQLDQYNRDIRDVLNHPQYCLSFLQPGRLVRIRLEAPSEAEETEYDFGWGVIVNFQKALPKFKNQDLTAAPEPPRYIVDVVLHCAPGTEKRARNPKPCPPDETGEMVVIACALSAIDGLSSVRVYVPPDLEALDKRQQLYRVMKEVKKRFPDGVPLLDPVEDMKITDDGFKKLIKVGGMVAHIGGHAIPS